MTFVIFLLWCNKVELQDIAQPKFERGAGISVNRCYIKKLKYLTESLFILACSSWCIGELRYYLAIDPRYITLL